MYQSLDMFYDQQIKNHYYDNLIILIEKEINTSYFAIEIIYLKFVLFYYFVDEQILTFTIINFFEKKINWSFVHHDISII